MVAAAPLLQGARVNEGLGFVFFVCPLPARQPISRSRGVETRHVRLARSVRQPTTAPARTQNRAGGAATCMARGRPGRYP